MWAFPQLVGSSLDLLPRALMPPCIHFRNFFPATLIPRPSKLQSNPLDPHPRILWEKNFLIARLIVGRAHPLAGWWRSVFPSFETGGRPEESAERNEPLPSCNRPSCRETWNWSAARLTDVREAPEAFYFLPWNNLFHQARSRINIEYARINIKYSSISLLREAYI